MAPYFGGIPSKTPASRRDLALFQRTLPPSVWHHHEPPFVRCGIVGTGDDLVVLAWTQAALAQEKDAGVALLRRFGLQPRMRVVNCLPGALSTPGSLLLGDVLEAIGALDVPVGPIRSDRDARSFWGTVTLMQADVLVTDWDSGARLIDSRLPDVAIDTLKKWIWLSDDPRFRPPSLPPAFPGQLSQTVWFTAPEAACFFGYLCEAGFVHVQEPARVELVSHIPAATTASLALVVHPRDPSASPPVVIPWPAAALQSCVCGAEGALNFT